MQFSIRLPSTPSNLAAVEAALLELDPAGVADMDRDGLTLRLSGNVTETELAAMLGLLGHPVRLDQVERLPSVCCGGCGG